MKNYVNYDKIVIVIIRSYTNYNKNSKLKNLVKQLLGGIIMMELSHVSPSIYLLTEDDRTIEFRNCRYDDKKMPTPEECKGALKGVCLSYAFCGEQDFGIEPMAKQFGATGKNGTITKIPKELEIVESEGVKAMKFGRYAELDSGMIIATKEAGVIGYWDDANLIICASPEYEFVIHSIREMFKPKHVRFTFSRSFAGRNLLILAI